MGDHFTTRLDVRVSDLDPNGHVRGPAYLELADHARWEWVRAAGIPIEELLGAGVGPVNLETTLRFVHELRTAEPLDVTVVPVWGDGRTSRVTQELRRRDGTVVATVESVGGLLDLERRRLVTDPQAVWRRLATHPEVLGL
ncbi:MAG TPA: thioesterase family protein [Acidimicrobiales bacterium]